MEDSIKKIGATIILEKVSSQIVEAVSMTSNLVMMALSLNTPEKARAAIKNFYEFTATVVPIAIEQKKILGLDFSMDEFLLNISKERLSKQSFTLDEILKNAGVNYNTNGTV